jgi:hypothetical protein
MAGHRIRLPGFRLDRNGRLVRDAKRLDVSTRLKQASSKRVRVVPPSPAELYCATRRNAPAASPAAGNSANALHRPSPRQPLAPRQDAASGVRAIAGARADDRQIDVHELFV